MPELRNLKDLNDNEVKQASHFLLYDYYGIVTTTWGQIISGFITLIESYQDQIEELERQVELERYWNQRNG
jgi:hypothetical protein